MHTTVTMTLIIIGEIPNTKPKEIFVQHPTPSLWPLLVSEEHVSRWDDEQQVSNVSDMEHRKEEKKGSDQRTLTNTDLRTKEVSH